MIQSVTPLTDGITRPASWFDPLSSWTIAGWFKAPDSSATYNTLFTHGDTSFVVGNIWLGIDTTGLYGYVWDGGMGVHYGETNKQTTGIISTAFYAALVFNGTSISLVFNGTNLGGNTGLTITTPFADSTQYVMTDTSAGSPVGNVQAGYLRIWQAALTAAELVSEQTSIIAVRQTNLLCDNLLQTSIDLTDHNGKLRQFSAIGTVITNTTDPLITTITAPPTNLDPNTALAVTVDSAIFQDTLTAGAATTVWYKCTAGLGVKVMGACGFGDLVTYKPTILVFEGLVNALNNDSLFGISGQNVPVQFPVTPGLDYYFKETRNSAVSPATIQFSVLNALDLPVPIGSIAVNNDDDIPLCALLDSATGYPINFISPFDAKGEGGDPLDSGTIIVTLDRATLKPILYNAILAPIGILNLANYTTVSSNAVDTFAIGFPGSGPTHAIIRLCDALGVLDPTVFTLAAAGLHSLGLNQDSSLAYYNATAFQGAIKSWDLDTNIAGADLVAGVTNYTNGKDLIVLKDNSILVPRSKLTATKSFIVKDYNAAGAELHSYDFGTDGDADNRIATAIDNPNSFWVWIKVQDNPFGGYSNFKNVKVSDGSILSSTGPVVQFEGSKFNGTAINTPARFGHSESCPFWITRVIIGPEVNARSGLYNLSGTGGTTRLFHDRVWIDASLGTTENLAIPNPFTESYLVGDE